MGSNRIRERGQRMIQKMIDREEKQEIEEKQLNFPKVHLAKR